MNFGKIAAFILILCNITANVIYAVSLKPDLERENKASAAGLTTFIYSISGFCTGLAMYYICNA